MLDQSREVRDHVNRTESVPTTDMDRRDDKIVVIDVTAPEPPRRKYPHWRRRRRDMNLPGLDLHELRGSRKGTWVVTVSGNWRVTFTCIGKDVERVDYEDYH